MTRRLSLSPLPFPRRARTRNRPCARDRLCFPPCSSVTCDAIPPGTARTIPEAAAGALRLLGFPLKVPEPAKPGRRGSPSSFVWRRPLASGGSVFGVVTAAAAAAAAAAWFFRAPPLVLSSRSRRLFPGRAMGLLSQGSPLSWEKTQRHAEHVRKHGIQQFLHIYRAVGERHKDVLKWGDEVEYMLVAFDHKNKRARLSLTGEGVLHTLQEKGERTNPNHPTLWRPEYGSYMIEGTPGQPYGGTMSEFNTVQDNMRKRRQEAASVLKKDVAICTVTSFPRLGCPGFTIPAYHPTPIETGASKSLFFPDEAINNHPRFSTLTRNIRHRRGEKVVINVPIFKDKNTPSPFIETFPSDDGEAARAAKPDHVYMDAMGFGMGNCCLQVTFQACSIFEARYLYDQLATICPIVMALSAAAPFYRGYVTDIDCRWGIISASVDDRTREERGLEPLKNNRFRINKSRYDSIDSYLSECGEKYNDIDLTIDKEIYEHLVKEGIDHLLAQHIAHLFIRDPLTLFEEKIHLDDANESDHFENIQSTNWQTMRFKPPPPNSDIGWRVEFRPMEVQLTDFENSAYVVFVVLLTRVILSYKLDFLIPLSKVDENMKVAQKRDAVRQGMFYFRKDISKGGNAIVDGCGATQNGTETDIEEYTLMSIDTIINGKEGVFPGLIPILNSYLENMEVDVDTRCSILNYLKLIKKRASGELMTAARWMREFVANHPEYKYDSVISEEMNYSLMWKCNEIAQEQVECPELLGVGLNKLKYSGIKATT